MTNTMTYEVEKPGCVHPRVIIAQLLCCTIYISLPHLSFAEFVRCTWFPSNELHIARQNHCYNDYITNCYIH